MVAVVAVSRDEAGGEAGDQQPAVGAERSRRDVAEPTDAGEATTSSQMRPGFSAP
jgi:hypothetical protein